MAKEEIKEVPTEVAETKTKKEKTTLTVEVTDGPQKGLVRTFAEGEEDAAASFKAKFNGQYI